VGAGSAGAAQAHGTSVHICIGAPAFHVGPGYGYRQRCWLPERHLCGPSYRRPVYRAPVYVGPVYGAPVYGAPVYGVPVYAPPTFYYGTYRRW
jgi:hypothetical protein